MRHIGIPLLAALLGLFAIASPALHHHAVADAAHHHHDAAIEHDHDGEHHHGDEEMPSDGAAHCAACDWQNVAAENSVPTPSLPKLFNVVAIFEFADFIAPLNDAIGFSQERAPPVCA
jgi:hypothetical protein